MFAGHCPKSFPAIWSARLIALHGMPRSGDGGPLRAILQVRVCKGALSHVWVRFRENISEREIPTRVLPARSWSGRDSGSTRCGNLCYRTTAEGSFLSSTRCSMCCVQRSNNVHSTEQDIERGNEALRVGTCGAVPCLTVKK